MVSLPDVPGQQPASQSDDGEPIAEEGHRALIGWLSDDEAIALLLGRTPTPADDLVPFRERFAAKRRAVSGRSVFEPRDPILEAEDQASLDRIAARPEVQATFANMNWQVAMVDLDAVLSLQKIIRLTGLDERLNPVIATSANLLEFCLPSAQPAIPGRVFTDGDRKGMTISSLNPNLRVVETQPVQVEAQAAPGAPAVPMQGLMVIVHLGTSYLQVARYNGRCFLRDGYHRAAGLVRAEIMAVPCIFIEAHSWVEVAPTPGLLTYETMFGERPPRLSDFWDPEVSEEVVRPAVRKVIRVRGDEFVVQV